MAESKPLSPEELAELEKMEQEEAAKKAEEEAKASAKKAEAVSKKDTKVLKVFNNTKAIHYLGDIRILPDNKGAEITQGALDAFKKNPGVTHLFETKQLEIR